MNSDALSQRIENLLGSASSGSVETPSARVPPTIPDHQLLRRIGGGSYGEVWLARSVTGALRAVKIVWRSRFSSERPYEREFRGIVQFEPISRSHPGVVNILHVGREDVAGCFFYVMELADAAQTVSSSEFRVPGDDAPFQPETQNSQLETYHPRTLASDLKLRERLPVGEAVSLGVQLASALGHLHRNRLVHRDVKPSNVIFVHGQAQLADIGLVTNLGEGHSFVGTEGFIPPEGPGSERADLFSLGRLLYEAATGKDRCEFPALPDDLDRWPSIEREALLELNEVLAKACAPEVKDRHANAAELAGDLNLILAGRSIRRAYGIERRLRNATRAAVAAIVVLALSAGAAWFQGNQRRQSELRAAQEASLRRRAELAEQATREQLYTALLEQGRALVLSGERGQRIRALDAVRQAGAISNSATLRSVAVAALALPDLRFERDWPAGSNLTLLVFAPAFDRIALCRGRGPVEIVSVADHRLLTELPASADRPAYVGSWSADGRLLAVKRDDQESGGRRPYVEVWDVAAGRRLQLLTNVTRSAFSFHPRRPWLIAGAPPSTAVIWDVEHGQEIARHALLGEPEALGYSPNGDLFAATHLSGKAWATTIHRTADGSKVAGRDFPDVLNDIAWHPSGQWLAVADHSGAVHRMDVETSNILPLGHHKSVAAVTEFRPAGDYLFTGGWDRELICWDTRTTSRAFAVGLDSYQVQIRADGRECAVIRSPGGEIQLHAFESPLLYRQLEEDLGGRWTYAAFSPDGRWLAAGGREYLGVWDLESDGPGALVPLKGEPTHSRLGFAPNGELFADGPAGCFRWRVALHANGSAPGLEPLELVKPAGSTSLSVNSNGVIWTGKHGSKLVANPDSPGEEGHWAPTSDGLNGVSPDGRWLGIFRGNTRQLCIHRLPGLEQVAILTNEMAIARFDFSPSSDEVAVACRQGVEFWSTATWERTRRLADFDGVRYSPDGRTLWLAQAYRSGGLYDARTAGTLLPLPKGTVPLAVSPDGRRLAVSQDSRRVQVWDLVEVRTQLRKLGLDWTDR